MKLSCSGRGRAKVVIEGIITDSDWLKSKLIAFLANQNGRKYQNKERLLGKLSGSAYTGLNFDMVSAVALATINLRVITEIT